MSIWTEAHHSPHTTIKFLAFFFFVFLQILCRLFYIEITIINVWSTLVSPAFLLLGSSEILWNEIFFSILLCMTSWYFRTFVCMQEDNSQMPLRCLSFTTLNYLTDLKQRQKGSEMWNLETQHEKFFRWTEEIHSFQQSVGVGRRRPRSTVHVTILLIWLYCADNVDDDTRQNFQMDMSCCCLNKYRNFIFLPFDLTEW